MKKLFWKVYRVEFISSDGTLRNVQFFRGRIWDVIDSAVEASKEKSKKENKEWSVYKVEKI